MVLRVKLEVVPYGVEDKAYEIGRLDIFNKTLRTDGVTEYGVINLTKGQEGLHDDVVLHIRKDGAWILVMEAINQLEIEGP